MKNTQISVSADLEGFLAPNSGAFKLADAIMSRKEVLLAIVAGPSLEEMRHAHQCHEPSIFQVMFSSEAEIFRTEILTWREEKTKAPTHVLYAEILMIAVHFLDDEHESATERLDQDLLPFGNGMILSRAHNSSFRERVFSLKPGPQFYDYHAAGVLGDYFVSGLLKTVETTRH